MTLNDFIQNFVFWRERLSTQCARSKSSGWSDKWNKENSIFSLKAFTKSYHIKVFIFWFIFEKTVKFPNFSHVFFDTNFCKFCDYIFTLELSKIHACVICWTGIITKLIRKRFILVCVHLFQNLWFVLEVFTNFNASVLKKLVKLQKYRVHTPFLLNEIL